MTQQCVTTHTIEAIEEEEEEKKTFSIPSAHAMPRTRPRAAARPLFHSTLIPQVQRTMSPTDPIQNPRISPPLQRELPLAPRCLNPCVPPISPNRINVLLRAQSWVEHVSN